MSCVHFTSLNSGSNGNCYYIGNDEEAVLIDAGLSCRETEKRMHRLGLSMKHIKAVFISHEHSDHIRGLEVLSRKYEADIYISAATLQHSRLRLPAARVKPLVPGVAVAIGHLQIHSFSKHHDAADPHSFMITHDEICVGVFTDIGRVCDNLSFHFKKCHAAFLEANYDEALLQNGRYPYHLKNRIRGGNGHLSNTEALNLFLTCRPAHMSHLLLSHLSADNNKPELVQSLFRGNAGDTHIEIASRYEATPVYRIYGTKVPVADRCERPAQLTLF